MNRLAPFAALALAAAVPAQFSPLAAPGAPAGNPVTAAKAVLGKILFWDEQLSSDDSMACGTCHVPEAGGGEPRTLATVHPGPDGVYGSIDDIHGSPGLTRQTHNGEFTPDAEFGLRRQVTRRQSPTNLMGAYHQDLFWDSRASSVFVDPETQQISLPFGGALESQAVGPILSAVEMATEGRTWQDVRQKLQAVRPLELSPRLTPDVQQALQQSPTYPDLFAVAFGDPAITAERIAFALATYQRTLVPDQTPWDRFVQGQTQALTAAQLRGWNLFQGVGRCLNCHFAPEFTDDMSHNLGLRPKWEDPGLGPIIQVPSEDGSFKTPSLRNSGLRSRLFHNGQSPALLDPSQPFDPSSVLNIYSSGGGVDRTNLDPFLTPLAQNNVTTADLLDILDFVANGLTDPRVAQGLPPFDHPALRALAVPPPAVFGQGLAGSRGEEPFLLDTVPAWQGNADYALGLAGGDGTTLGACAYGLSAIVPTLVAGLPWNVQIADFRAFVLQGPAGAPGVATWHLPVPRDPNLTNLALYFQPFVLDPGAPTGIAVGKGSEFRL